MARVSHTKRKGYGGVRAYARHRGVSHVSVLAALDDRIAKAATRNGRRVVIDFALADRLWAANTDLTKAPTRVKERAAARGEAVPSTSLAEAAAEEKRWKAERAKLEFQARSGELILAKEVELRLVEDFARFRTKALGVPSKARQLIHSLTAADVRTLMGLMRELLEELSSMRAAVEKHEGEVA